MNLIDVSLSTSGLLIDGMNESYWKSIDHAHLHLMR